MNIEDTIRKIGEIGIIPVLRAASFEEARQAADAIYAGGIPVLEITMTVPNAPAVIREVVRHYGNKVLTGAGTVVNSEQAMECLDAGAEFLVSPGLSLQVLHLALARDKLAIPGALTPTEIMTAAREGARVIKIFPCENIGGPKYIRALKAPFPKTALIPSGGVNLSNAVEYIAAGAFALGTGADLVNLPALREGRGQEIVEAARKLLASVCAARQSSHER